MNSNYGTSFISARANIGNNVLIGNNVSIYGSCKVGDNSIIESNAIIGHPSFVELNNIDRNKFCSLNEYYDARSVHPIIIGCNSVIRSNSVNLPQNSGHVLSVNIG
jgi:UDP-3-O-[3-hydroxymyristoyl] glucosamine N-acyltransferase